MFNFYSLRVIQKTLEFVRNDKTKYQTYKLKKKCILELNFKWKIKVAKTVSIFITLLLYYYLKFITVLFTNKVYFNN